MSRVVGLDGTFSKYVGCCVNLNGDDIISMVDAAMQVTAQTFKSRIGSQAYAWLESELGYSDLQFKLANDYAVSFHRSKYQGETCYYCRWSAIEYIFVEG